MRPFGAYTISLVAFELDSAPLNRATGLILLTLKFVLDNRSIIPSIVPGECHAIASSPSWISRPPRL